MWSEVGDRQRRMHQALVQIHIKSLRLEGGRGEIRPSFRVVSVVMSNDYSTFLRIFNLLEHVRTEALCTSEYQGSQR